MTSGSCFWRLVKLIFFSPYENWDRLTCVLCSICSERDGRFADENGREVAWENPEVGSLFWPLNNTHQIAYPPLLDICSYLTYIGFWSGFSGGLWLWPLCHLKFMIIDWCFNALWYNCKCSYYNLCRAVSSRLLLRCFTMWTVGVNAESYIVSTFSAVL